jgi:hypothetical protein
MANQTKTFLLFILAAIVLITGCRPDSAVDLGGKATASFTLSPVAGKVNTYALQSTSINAFGYQWDKGTGSYAKGNQADTAYFPLKGTYKVQLRAFGRGGYDSASQSVTITIDDIVNNPNFQMLTAKSWKLNPADGANAIIVGTDANPAAYFGGGALDNCQKDDVYTFTSALKLNYNANGATFNAGNIAPNYTCGTDRSYNNVGFTFILGGAAGAIATITLPGTVPTNFIGVTDVSSNNYRVMSISSTSMVLRSGTSSETVHQFKFIAQ